MNLLTNGLGEQKPSIEAIPPLKDPRVFKVARVLCTQRGYDLDDTDGGGVCLDECIGDGNWWYVDRKNGNAWVYIWMRFIENAIEILEELDKCKE